MCNAITKASLEAGMVIDRVYSDGVPVCENGALTVNIQPYTYPDWAVHTVHLKKLRPADFRIPANHCARPKVRVMEYAAGTVDTKSAVVEMEARL